MWGRRKRRCAQLPRQLALALLEDAMGQVQQPQEPEEGEPTVYPGSVPAPAAPSAHAGLQPADVPLDNSAGPDTPPQGELSAQHTAESTRHGTFGRNNLSQRTGICSEPSANRQVDGAHWREKDSGAPT